MKSKFKYTKPLYLLKNDDHRADEFKAFKKEHGFSPDECWSLDCTVLEFLYPRLVYFRDATSGFPHDFETMDEWREAIDKMILAVEIYLIDMSSDEKFKYKNEVRINLVDFEEKNRWSKEGFDLLFKYFFDLWW